MHLSGHTWDISASQWNLPSISTALCNPFLLPGPRSSPPDSSHPLSPYVSTCMHYGIIEPNPSAMFFSLRLYICPVSGIASLSQNSFLFPLLTVPYDHLAFQKYSQPYILFVSYHHQYRLIRCLSFATGSAGTRMVSARSQDPDDVMMSAMNATSP